MPIDYREYSKDWKLLSSNLRKAAGNKCELCWAPNGENVYRSAHLPHPWSFGVVTDDPLTKIVLTVHHIDGDNKNNVRQNLIVLCQRCHCRLDLAKHMENSAKTRRLKRGY